MARSSFANLMWERPWTWHVRWVGGLRGYGGVRDMAFDGNGLVTEHTRLQWKQSESGQWRPAKLAKAYIPQCKPPCGNNVGSSLTFPLCPSSHVLFPSIEGGGCYVCAHELVFVLLCMFMCYLYLGLLEATVCWAILGYALVGYCTFGPLIIKALLSLQISWYGSPMS